MPRFLYTILTSEGKKVKGYMTKPNSSDVVYYLKSKNHTVLDVKKVNVLTDDIRNVLTFNDNINDKYLSIFCRQLYFFLSSGISLDNALDIIYTNSKKLTIKNKTKSIKENILKGKSFSDSLKEEKGFPKLIWSIFKVGEKTGKLDYLAKELSIYYEEQFRSKDKIMGTLIYPIIVVIAMIIFIIFAVTFILPEFLEIFSTEGIEFPLSTRILLATSNFISKNFFLLTVLFLLLLIFVPIFLKTKKGMFFKDTVFLKSKLYKKILSYRFSKVLSLLLDSGVSLLESIEILRDVLGNRKLDYFISEMYKDIEKGESLSSSLSKIKYFDEILVIMAKTGEETGFIAQILEKSADYLSFDIKTMSNKIGRLIEPMTIIFIGFILLFIVLSIVIPVFSANYMYTY